MRRFIERLYPETGMFMTDQSLTGAVLMGYAYQVFMALR